MGRIGFFSCNGNLILRDKIGISNFSLSLSVGDTTVQTTTWTKITIDSSLDNNHFQCIHISKRVPSPYPEYHCLMQWRSACQLAKLNYVCPNSHHKSVLPTREISVRFGKGKWKTFIFMLQSQWYAKCFRLTHRYWFASFAGGVGQQLVCCFSTTARSYPSAPLKGEPDMDETP